MLRGLFYSHLPPKVARDFLLLLFLFFFQTNKGLNKCVTCYYWWFFCSRGNLGASEQQKVPKVWDEHGANIAGSSSSETHSLTAHFIDVLLWTQTSLRGQSSFCPSVSWQPPFQTSHLLGLFFPSFFHWNSVTLLIFFLPGLVSFNLCPLPPEAPLPLLPCSVLSLRPSGFKSFKPQPWRGHFHPEPGYNGS